MSGPARSNRRRSADAGQRRRDAARLVVYGEQRTLCKECRIDLARRVVALVAAHQEKHVRVELDAERVEIRNAAGPFGHAI